MPRAPQKPRPQAPSPAELEALLGHRFRHPELLERALTHRSFVFDHAGNANPDLSDPSHDNEQLEFLGDAVLGLLAAQALTERYPHLREGELTRLRSSVVSRKHLGKVGARLELGRWLLLGRTAEEGQARTNAALLANAVEALLAALYLDGGLEVARRFVAAEILAGALPDVDPAHTETILTRATGDFKTALQEELQNRGLRPPQYVLLAETGPPHQRIFHMEVRVPSADGTPDALAAAEASSKKQAQQEAARLALDRLTPPSAQVSRHG